jgi:hypothetical protein
MRHRSDEFDAPTWWDVAQVWAVLASMVIATLVMA